MRGKNNSEEGIALYSLSFFPRLPFERRCDLFLVKSRYSWQNVPLKLAPKVEKETRSRVEPLPRKKDL
jgi:hypothetical protein